MGNEPAQHPATQDKKAPAQKPAAQPDRSAWLGPTPDSIWLGEHVVGDSGRVHVQLPENLGMQPYTPDIESAGRFEVEGGPHQSVQPSSSSKERRHLVVDFTTASTPGSFGAHMIISAIWPDLSRSERKVYLHGMGREPNQLAGYRSPPPPSISPQAAKTHRLEEARYQEDQKHTEPYPQNHENNLNAASTAARDAAADLASAQQRGLRTVNAEVATYRPPPPLPRPLWWDIVELALVLGTAGVAQIASKHVVNFLAQVVTAKDVSEKLFVEGIQEAVKTGLETAGQAAIGAGIAAADRGTNEHKFSSGAIGALSGSIARHSCARSARSGSSKRRCSEFRCSTSTSTRSHAVTR